MRLGAQECKLVEGSLAFECWAKIISERHRHRYEVNNTWLPALVKAGLKVADLD